MNDINLLKEEKTILYFLKENYFQEPVLKIVDMILRESKKCRIHGKEIYAIPEINFVIVDNSIKDKLIGKDWSRCSSSQHRRLCRLIKFSKEILIDSGLIQYDPFTRHYIDCRKDHT